MRSPGLQTILVFDIGGTSMRAALFDASTNSISAIRRCGSPNHLSRADHAALPAEILAKLVELGAEVAGDRQPDIVCIAFPGPLDPKGNTLATPTLLGGDQASAFPIGDMATRSWPSSRVHVLNDLTAAGYRYAAELRDFCILTVGSGIGHKVFLGGAPQVGPAGRGGEIGHLRIDMAADALPCDCGGKGHLGAMASGRGTLRLARRNAMADAGGFGESMAGDLAGGNPDQLDNAMLVRSFHTGDAWTREVVREAAGRLGQGLAAIHLVIGIETFIITGGFANALGEGYRRLLVEGSQAAGWNLGQDWNRMIRFGSVEDDDVLVGAGRYAAGIAAGTPGPQALGMMGE
jgi:predicted NBD/HSP70 family sugar kinase